MIPMCLSCTFWRREAKLSSGYVDIRKAKFQIESGVFCEYNNCIPASADLLLES